MKYSKGPFKSSNSLNCPVIQSSGGRYPSVSEMFVNTTGQGITAIPNDSLRAEWGWVYEIGGNYRPFTGVVIDLAAFDQEYFDMIEPILVPHEQSFAATFTNYTRDRISDLELNVRGDIVKDLVWGRIGYVYTQSRQLKASETEVSKALPYRPDHSLVGEIVFPYGGFSISPVFTYRSKSIFTYSTDVPNVDTQLWDLNMSYSWSFLQVDFQVKNLFQHNFAEVDNHMAEIRNYTLTLTLHPPIPN